MNYCPVCDDPLPDFDTHVRHRVQHERHPSRWALFNVDSTTPEIQRIDDHDHPLADDDAAVREATKRALEGDPYAIGALYLHWKERAATLVPPQSR